MGHAFYPLIQPQPLASFIHSSFFRWSKSVIAWSLILMERWIMSDTLIIVDHEVGGTKKVMQSMERESRVTWGLCKCTVCRCAYICPKEQD